MTGAPQTHLISGDSACDLLDAAARILTSADHPPTKTAVMSLLTTALAVAWRSWKSDTATDDQFLVSANDELRSALAQIHQHRTATHQAAEAREA